MTDLHFKVSGINCEACTKLIKMDLEDLPGVKEVKVELSGEVFVSSDKLVTLEDVRKVLEDTDYKVIKE